MSNPGAEALFQEILDCRCNFEKRRGQGPNMVMITKDEEKTLGRYGVPFLLKVTPSKLFGMKVIIVDQEKVYQRVFIEVNHGGSDA